MGFRERLKACGRRCGDRRWVYVPYDQLSDSIGPLSSEDPRELGIVLVESTWKGTRRRYHRQKLAFILAGMRHFALEQAERGVAVRHVVCDSPYRAALRPLAAELGPLRAMEPAERELRRDLAPLVDDGLIELLPHEGWLTTWEDFEASAGSKPPWRMDRFYAHVRRKSGILMDGRGKPLGGKYSHDADNRRPWKGAPPAPEPPRFEPGEITLEVGRLVERVFSDHPGRLSLERLPVTLADAERLWSWAREECLPSFGPYEDAMSTRSRGLFHTRIAALLNVHRLLPSRVVKDALELDLPLSSKEGFVRQILGWREFVRHVHVSTDGFRRTGRRRADEEAGARPSALRAHRSLPPAYWGAPSGLNCLDRVVDELWDEGYTHHIPRLMVLSNLATLLAVEPRELCDWFWVAFVDAFDWVVEPNVLGMGTCAVGDLMTTKPYVCGAAYIDRMSDYCSTCRFDPRTDCPVTNLYWRFLERNAGRLAGNRRISMPLRSAAKRGEDLKRRDRLVERRVRETLARGAELRPDDLP